MACVLALAFAGPALSQPVPRLQRPFSVNGTIAASPGSTAATRPYAEYRFHLSEGQRVRIAARSTDIDTVVEVYDQLNIRMGRDDDSGGGSNSLLTFRVGYDGAYAIRVLSFWGNGGSFSLRVEPIAGLADATGLPDPTRTTPWAVVEGSLTATDAESSGNRVDDYAVHLDAGEQIIVRLDSTAFDPKVAILAELNRDVVIAQNDDSGEGNNALLLFTAAEEADYVVRVSSFSGTQLGNYTLWVGRIPAP